MFSNPKFLILLKKSSLAIYDTSGKLAHIDFPPEVVHDEQVADPLRFEEMVQKFLGEISLHEEKAIIVLSQELLHQKTLPISNEKDEDVKAKAFFDTLPFNSDDLAKMVLKRSDSVDLVATHKKLFQLIVAAAEKMGWHIEATVPLSVFGTIHDEENLRPETVKQILENMPLVGLANFLDNDKVGTSDPLSTQTPTKSSISKKTIILFLASLCIGIAGFFAVKTFFFHTRGGNSPTQNVVPTVVLSPSPSITASTSSESATVTGKKDIKVRIRNGTGTPGEAGKVRDEITKLGFKDIQVGNASTNSGQTTASFSARVAKDTKDEVESLLKKLFTKVLSSSAASESKFDIDIVTGK